MSVKEFHSIKVELLNSLVKNVRHILISNINNGIYVIESFKNWPLN